MVQRDPMTPDNVLAAAKALEDDLPALFGEAWLTVEPAFREHLAALEAAPDDKKHLAMLQLVKVFRSPTEARERFREAVIRQDEVGGALLRMADIVREHDQDLASSLRDAAQADSGVRKATLKAPDKAYSFKLANLVFDFGEIGAASAAVATALSDHIVTDEVTPFAVGVGILVITQLVVQELTVEFDEREATVLWGFAETADNEEREATEADILGITNAARDRIGLERLDEKAVRNALHKLEQLRTVERVSDNTWRIVEKIRRREG